MTQEATLRCEKGNAAAGACELAADARDARHGPGASMMAPKIRLICTAQYYRRGLCGGEPCPLYDLNFTGAAALRLPPGPVYLRRSHVTNAQHLPWCCR
jgi:hypothetical protein